jgi:hypothetical protein
MRAGAAVAEGTGWAQAIAAGSMAGNRLASATLFRHLVITHPAKGPAPMLASDTSSADQPPGPSSGEPRRRWLIWAPVLILCAAVGAWLGLRYSSTGRQAQLAAGYVAHVTCSCRFVGGRAVASCDTDREPGTEVVQVSEDSAKRTITAKVPLLASRTARFDPEYGCTLDPP